MLLKPSANQEEQEKKKREAAAIRVLPKTVWKPTFVVKKSSYYHANKLYGPQPEYVEDEEEGNDSSL
jgi:hypothetical protein